MKNKLSFISIFTLCIALSLTACGGKQSSNTDSKNTQTEAGSETSGKSDSKLDDLYQQENQLFADAVGHGVQISGEQAEDQGQHHHPGPDPGHCHCHSPCVCDGYPVASQKI